MEGVIDPRVLGIRILLMVCTANPPFVRGFFWHLPAPRPELIRKSGKSIGGVAHELDLAETAVRRWGHQAEIDAGRGPAGALTTAERNENLYSKDTLALHTMSGTRRGNVAKMQCYRRPQ